MSLALIVHENKKLLLEELPVSGNIKSMLNISFSISL